MATLASYVSSVWFRVSQGKPESDIGIYRAAIETTLDAALQRLGQATANSPDPAVRARLQKSFSLTLSSGDIALNAAMVTNVLPQAQATLSGITEPLQYVPFYQDVINPLPLADFYYWTVHEGKIKVRDSLGAVPSATALTVYTSYIPAIAEVPDELADDLYDIGVDLISEINNPADVEEESHSVNYSHA